MKSLPAVLPDDLPTWRGTAAELADKGNTLLESLNLESDATLNERLIRYYVTEKLLTPPEREGKEAIFGFRQVIELLVIRYLLHDQWPLAKIRDIVQSVDLDTLQGLLPPERPRTAAEEAVSRIRGRRPARGKADRVSAGHVEEPSARYQQPPSDRKRRERMPAERVSDGSSTASRTMLDLAAGTTIRRTRMRENLRTLGNPDGEVERRMTMRYTLTPWCQVIIDFSRLRSMPDDAPETLGAALTQLLREERNKRGGKS